MGSLVRFALASALLSFAVACGGGNGGAHDMAVADAGPDMSAKLLYAHCTPGPGSASRGDCQAGLLCCPQGCPSGADLGGCTSVDECSPPTQGSCPLQGNF